MGTPQDEIGYLEAALLAGSGALPDGANSRPTLADHLMRDLEWLLSAWLGTDPSPG